MEEDTKQEDTLDAGKTPGVYRCAHLRAEDPDGTPEDAKMHQEDTGKTPGDTKLHEEDAMQEDAMQKDAMQEDAMQEYAGRHAGGRHAGGRQARGRHAEGRGRWEDSGRTPWEDAGGGRREDAKRTTGGHQKRSPERLLREHILSSGSRATLLVCEPYPSASPGRPGLVPMN